MRSPASANSAVADDNEEFIDVDDIPQPTADDDRPFRPDAERDNTFNPLSLPDPKDGRV